MIRKAIKKALRIMIWTTCFLAFALFYLVQGHGVRGLPNVLEMLTNLDSFLAILGFFLCLIAAFIADLLYTSKFG